MSFAGQARTDIEVSKYEKTTLYRGGALTKAEAHDYKDKVDKVHQEDGPEGSGIKKGYPVSMSMFGYISTSTDRSAAERFTWSNDKQGKIDTLFIIEWNRPRGYYVMNMGIFNEEKEVLLADGTRFRVKEVEESEKNDKPLYIITL